MPPNLPSDNNNPNPKIGINFDQVQSEFVSIAAHQLRTPLTTIRWSLQSLLDGDLGTLTPEAKRVVDESLKVTVEAVGLVNELLSIARIEEGRLPFNPKEADLLSLSTAITMLFEAEANSRGVILNTEFPEKLLPVIVDPDKIQMALENVVDNAIAYTPRGGSVTINLTEKGDSIVYVIKDTGIGIPKDQMSRLFKKFFRADNALLFRTAGTGLGLYLAKSIIEKHGGSIDIQSIEKEGTTVTITLPKNITV